MVVRHSRDFGGLRWPREVSEEADVERVPLCARMRKARTTIMAAKLAYATNAPQWLGLFGRAVGLIEACPTQAQDALLASLCVLQQER